MHYGTLHKELISQEISYMLKSLTWNLNNYAIMEYKKNALRYGDVDYKVEVYIYKVKVKK